MTTGTWIYAVWIGFLLGMTVSAQLSRKLGPAPEDTVVQFAGCAILSLAFLVVMVASS